MATDATLQVEPGTGLAYRAVGPAAPEALLVLMHGVGGNETHLEGLAASLDTRLLKVLLRAPLPLGAAGFGWFEVAFGPQGPVLNAAQAEAGLQLLAAFIGNLQAETGLPPARTVVAGFSQGGIMSAVLGLTHPERVAGFGLLSGRLPPEFVPAFAAPETLGNLSGFVSHGLNDPVLPPVWADRTDTWLERLGVVHESRRYPAGHELTPAMARDFRRWLRARLWPQDGPGV